TGIDSPVIIDSSTALEPAVTCPSMGIFSPGRTTTTSLTRTSSTGTSISLPSRITCAVLACRPISFLIACEVRPLTLISSARPRTTSGNDYIRHVPEHLPEQAGIGEHATSFRNGFPDPRHFLIGDFCNMG